MISNGYRLVLPYLHTVDFKVAANGFSIKEVSRCLVDFLCKLGAEWFHCLTTL